jgi:hypothetical protein
MPLPTFLIAGAQKSGTSSLVSYLGSQPEIHVYRGETLFFADEEEYARGLDWYASLFHPAEGVLHIGEKSPNYSATPEPSERIARDLPEAKILWIFRNPVDRAYSNYWHRIREGSEVRPFAEAIEAEIEAFEAGTLSHHSYLGLGLFARHVQWFARFWPVEQMHYLVLEEFKRDPEAAVRGVYDFLAIPQPDRLELPDKVYNRFYRPRSLALQRLLYRFGGDRQGLRGKLFYWLSQLNRSTVRSYPAMEPNVRERLARFYEPHNRRLAELTGLDLSPWDSARR